MRIQLRRAEIKKSILIKNIYKEYENYLQKVRDCILSSAEKGIFSINSDLSISDEGVNSKELYIFLNKNISSLIHSILPLITIEQLNLRDISDSQKQQVNINKLKQLVESKESQTINFEYENEFIIKEPLKFYCNNNSNTYEYYESLNEEEVLSINLDESCYLNSFSKQIDIEKIEYEKNIVDSVLELIEEKNDNKFNDYEKINDQLTDVFISNDNLNFFDFIDKSFSSFLLNLSYKVNAELFKIKIIKKIISEDSFKCLSNNNHIIKHPYPFVIKYDLNQNDLPLKYNKTSYINLFSITSVELEFYNLDLSICRNNINELKNKFRLLNKKQKYWKNKDLI